MTIALDYDGTYTLDPKLWDRFTEEAFWLGHKVFCVTSRPEASPVERVPANLSGIFYTSGAAKRDFVCRVRGVPIDVWIDDRPEDI